MGEEIRTKIIENIKKAKICEFLNLSEVMVNSMSSSEVTERVLDKLHKEGYLLELNAEGPGFSFSKYY